MAELAALTLASICQDVQIRICLYLALLNVCRHHSSNQSSIIIKTCKAFHRSTATGGLSGCCASSSMPWQHISDMSDLEIEKVA